MVRQIMPNQTDRTTTFRDRTRVFFRWRNLVLLSAAALAIVLLIAAHVVPVEYTAATVFEMRVGLVVPDRGMEGVTDTERLKRLRQTVRQHLTDRQAIATVAERLGLFDGIDSGDEMSEQDVQAARQSIIAGIRQSLDVRWDAQSDEVDLIKLSFTSGNQDAVADVPNMLVANYEGRARTDTVEDLAKTDAFLNTRVNIYKKQLATLTGERIELETTYVGLSANTQEDIVRREQQAKADRDAVRRLLNIAKQKVARLEAMRRAVQGEELDRPIKIIKGPNPELERLGQELREYKTELDLAMTLQHMTRDHPVIKTLLARIAIMEERIRNTPEEIVLERVFGAGGAGETYVAQVAAAQSEVEILGAELDRVESQIEGYEKMMAGFEQVRPRYVAILEDLDDLRAKWQMWEHRRRQVEMALEATQAQEQDAVTQMLTVIEKAERPARPAFPALNHVMVVTFLGALAFGSLTIFFFNVKDRTVSTSEQAGRIFKGTAVLGTVGEIGTRGLKAQQAFRRWILTPIVAAVILVVLAVLVFSISLKLRHPEDYRQWRENPVQYVQSAADGPTTSP